MARTQQAPRPAEGEAAASVPTKLASTGYVAALLLMGIVLVLATVGLVICAAVGRAHPLALLAIPLELVLLVAAYRTTSSVLARMDPAPERARLRVDAVGPYRVAAAPDEPADVEPSALPLPEPNAKREHRRT